jgi:serine/threonine protein kinase
VLKSSEIIKIKTGNSASNHFTTGELLGRGSFGLVYRGTSVPAKVAIKRILIDGVDQEYEVMKKLDHPN